MVRRVAETVFIPFTVGGGIRTVEDFRMLLREGADKISAVLSLPDEVGSLHEVLTIFAVHGLNLVKLESRPLPGRSWPSCSASSPLPRASRSRSLTAR